VLSIVSFVFFFVVQVTQGKGHSVRAAVAFYRATKRREVREACCSHPSPRRLSAYSRKGEDQRTYLDKVCGKSRLLKTIV
jgi:hypothetical protein